jgi:hypothetical protein
LKGDGMGLAWRTAGEICLRRREERLGYRGRDSDSDSDRVLVLH